MTNIPKGSHKLLYYATDRKSPVHVGLSWDPKVRANVMEKLEEMMGGKTSYTDMDLAAYVYDKDENFMGLVSAKAEDITSFTPHIYHSGDNMDGEGEGDDETVTIEFMDLDEKVHHILFKASIASGHLFAEVDMPEMRLVRSPGQEVLLQASLDLEKNKSAFVFARVFKDDKGNWHFENVEEFTHANENKNWAEDLKIYLR